MKSDIFRARALTGPVCICLTGLLYVFRHLSEKSYGLFETVLCMAVAGGLAQQEVCH